MKIGKDHGFIAFVAALATPASAVAEDRRVYVIAEQDLGAALRAFAETSGREVVVSTDLVAAKRSRAVNGDFSAEAAIARMLSRAGLRAELVDGAFVVRPIVDQSRADDEAVELVVTGTRIRGTAPVGAPVTVVDRAAIDRSGRGSVAEILETIPQNFGGGPNEATASITLRNNGNQNFSGGAGVNLRGIGTTATLVLLDGVRPPLGGSSASFADVSLIPATALDRVEVLTDGASAIYGTDAIAGVVNFRFRNRFEGFETRVRAATADGDFGDYRLSQIAGTRWTGGGGVLALEFAHRDALPGRERAFYAEDLRRFGGPDLRSGFANPGTIVAADGSIFGIPAGQDGTALTPSDLLPGQQNRSDQQRSFDILSRQRRVSVYAAVDQEITDDINVFARALLAERRSDARQRFLGQQPVVVPTTNAFYVDPIGTNQPVTVFYDFARDLGTEAQRARVRSVSAIAGVEASLGAWSIELTGTYGRQHEDLDLLNFVNRPRLAAALADSDPATAFNVFGDGSPTNPATVARVRGSGDGDSRGSSWSAAIRADGPLARLPGGDLKLALGAERREERFDAVFVLDRGAALSTTRLDAYPAKRTVAALYGELFVPVFAGDTFPGTLALALAGRIERYSDVGTTRNPKASARWEFAPGIALRGSYGRSFRAPLFEELGGVGDNIITAFPIPDPNSSTGQTATLVLSGNVPDLRPERATTYSAGIELRPEWLAGVSADIGYFKIDYRDRIGTASIDLFNYFNRRDLYGALIIDNPSPETVATFYADPTFQNPFGIPAGDIRAILEGRTLNLSRTTLDGLDFDLRYARSVGRGELTLSARATHFFRIDQTITPSAPPDDIVGTLGAPVAWRVRAGLGFATDDGASASLFVNYTDSYRNQQATPAARVASNTTVDAQVGTRIGLTSGRSLRLSLSAINLFDRAPPYVLDQNILSVLGYDPEKASPAGRILSVDASIAW